MSAEEALGRLAPEERAWEGELALSELRRARGALDEVTLLLDTESLEAAASRRRLGE